MRLNRILALAIPSVVLLAVFPDRPTAMATQKGGWYERAVKNVEAKFEPAEAKPGQTVTFKLTVDLKEGYHTYPTVQPDKLAASMVNTITFPAPAGVIFVGPVTDPKDFETKAEPELMIKELRYSSGTAVFTRKAVISPKAAAGSATVKLESFKLLVCDKSNCFPPKAVPVEASLKILDGPAVAVEKEFADEVAKALVAK
jgi:hypothetical protein